MISSDISHAELIFHRIMHSDISLEYGIYSCKDCAEVTELLRKLITCGELTEEKYEAAMHDMSQKGMLDKFREEGENYGHSKN